MAKDSEEPGRTRQNLALYRKYRPATFAEVRGQDHVTQPLRQALRSGRLGAYLSILVVGSGARLFGLASQFVVLLILSRTISKGSFGDLMTAFGFYRLAAMALGIMAWGPGRVSLDHLVRQYLGLPEDIR